jgi:hypothetical protein
MFDVADASRRIEAIYRDVTTGRPVRAVT